MSANSIGAVLGTVFGIGIGMYILFLIFLGLFALIPPLRQRFMLRNIVAWFSGSLFSVLVSHEEITFVVMASIVSALFVFVRYKYVTRQKPLLTDS